MKSREKTKEQLQEDLRITRKELAVQEWANEKTLEGMKVLVRELIQRGKEAKEAKVKDEAILASIGDGLIATDKNAQVIFCNKAIETLIGWKKEEVIGKSWLEVVPMEDEKGNTIPNDKRPITQAISLKKSTTTTTSTYYFVRRNKTKFPVAVTATPIILEEKVIGAIGIYRDITHERDIDKAKTEFVSLASHQLRTPLTTIKWYSEMLLAGDAGAVNPEQEKYLAEIYHGSQHLTEIVNGLLTVSRLELGTFSVTPEPTEVLALVSGVVRELQPMINLNKIKLNESYTNSLPKLDVDPKLLRIILQNLLTNAVRYTPEGGEVKLQISLSDDKGKPTTNSSHLLIKISDTGCGIPEAQKDKIFTKLFRADNVREKYSEGTGLGLYVVKGILDHSEGRIWFESIENKGTTFYVTLPLYGIIKKEGTTQLA